MAHIELCTLPTHIMRPRTVSTLTAPNQHQVACHGKNPSVRPCGPGSRSLCLTLVVFAQRTNPDVTEAHRISVFVELNKPLGRMRIVVVAHPAMRRVAVELAPIMNN